MKALNEAIEGAAEFAAFMQSASGEVGLDAAKHQDGMSREQLRQMKRLEAKIAEQEKKLAKAKA